MKQKLVLILIVFISLTSCKTENETFKNINITELKSALLKDKNIQLLDVRTPQECSKGTIQNAKEINVTASNFEQKAIKQLDKTKPVYIYCRSGGRSRIASRILAKNGYDVYNIDGGYMSWLDNN